MTLRPPSHNEPIAIGDRNMNPEELTFWELIKEDFQTHERNIIEPGLWAILTHRFGNWRMGFKWKIIRAPLTLIYYFLYIWNRWIFGIEFPYNIPMGRRVRIWHQGGMVLGARSIGNDVHIRQNNTYGVVRREENDGRPIIEDGVDIGCGAVILGPITVGRGSVVGANAVVIRDVPPYSLVAGVPAKVVKSLRDEKIEDCDSSEEKSASTC